MEPTAEDVRAAAERIAPYVPTTPLLPFPADGPGALAEGLWAKPENLQRTSSFKLRGAVNFLARLDPERRARGVVTHSSGNHGQAVACAAALFGVRATVVIPEGAPEVKVRRTGAWGAEIVRCRNSGDDRERVALESAQARGATLVPPFDHPWIVAGQGTVGLEVARELPRVANVLVPIGGGGLSAGICLALADAAPSAQVIGVEPVLAADAAESLHRDVHTRWPSERVTRTMADGVRSQAIGELNFQVLRRHLADVVTVSEEAIKRATAYYPRHARLVVEPTGALTLAAWLRLRSGEADGVQLADGATVLVVSGGNVDEAVLATFLTDPALR